MKITGVTTTAIDYAGPSGPMPACIVRLETDASLTGIGIAAASAQRGARSLAGELLLGEDPRSATALWKKLAEACTRKKHKRQWFSAAAALDAALWDLKAKANGEPLWKTLGGLRPSANAHIRAGATQADDAELRAWLKRTVETFGFHRGALVIGGNPKVDARRLALMRDALAGSSRVPELIVDAGSRWLPTRAIGTIGRLEADFDLSWVVAPVDTSDAEGLKRVSENVAAAVCAGGHLHSATEYLPYFRAAALDMVQIDLTRTGISGALQIADAAYGLELPVTLSPSPGNFGAQVAAAMPNFASMEVIDPVPSRGVLKSDVTIGGGRAIAGDASGNGLRIESER